MEAELSHDQRAFLKNATYLGTRVRDGMSLYDVSGSVPKHDLFGEPLTQAKKKLNTVNIPRCRSNDRFADAWHDNVPPEERSVLNQISNRSYHSLNNNIGQNVDKGLHNIDFENLMMLASCEQTDDPITYIPAVLSREKYDWFEYDNTFVKYQAPGADVDEKKAILERLYFHADGVSEDTLIHGNVDTPIHGAQIKDVFTGNFPDVVLPIDAADTNSANTNKALEPFMGSEKTAPAWRGDGYPLFMIDHETAQQKTDRGVNALFPFSALTINDLLFMAYILSFIPQDKAVNFKTYLSTITTEEENPRTRAINQKINQSPGVQRSIIINIVVANYIYFKTLLNTARSVIQDAILNTEGTIEAHLYAIAIAGKLFVVKFQIAKDHVTSVIFNDDINSEVAKIKHDEPVKDLLKDFQNEFFEHLIIEIGLFYGSKPGGQAGGQADKLSRRIITIRDYKVYINELVDIICDQSVVADHMDPNGTNQQIRSRSKVGSKKNHHTEKNRMGRGIELLLSKYHSHLSTTDKSLKRGDLGKVLWSTIKYLGDKSLYVIVVEGASIKNILQTLDDDGYKSYISQELNRLRRLVRHRDVTVKGEDKDEWSRAISAQIWSFLLSERPQFMRALLSRYEKYSDGYVNEYFSNTLDNENKKKLISSLNIRGLPLDSIWMDGVDIVHHLADRLIGDKEWIKISLKKQTPKEMKDRYDHDKKNMEDLRDKVVIDLGGLELDESVTIVEGYTAHDAPEPDENNFEQDENNFEQTITGMQADLKKTKILISDINDSISTVNEWREYLEKPLLEEEINRVVKLFAATKKAPVPLSVVRASSRRRSQNDNNSSGENYLRLLVEFTLFKSTNITDGRLGEQGLDNNNIDALFQFLDKYKKMIDDILRIDKLAEGQGQGKKVFDALREKIKALFNDALSSSKHIIGIFKMLHGYIESGENKLKPVTIENRTEFESKKGKLINILSAICLSKSILEINDIKDDSFSKLYNSINWDVIRKLNRAELYQREIEGYFKEILVTLTDSKSDINKKEAEFEDRTRVVKKRKGQARPEQQGENKKGGGIYNAGDIVREIIDMINRNISRDNEYTSRGILYMFLVNLGYKYSETTDENRVAIDFIKETNKTEQEIKYLLQILENVVEWVNTTKAFGLKKEYKSFSIGPLIFNSNTKKYMLVKRPIELYMLILSNKYLAIVGEDEGKIKEPVKKEPKDLFEVSGFPLAVAQEAAASEEEAAAEESEASEAEAAEEEAVASEAEAAEEEAVASEEGSEASEEEAAAEEATPQQRTVSIGSNTSDRSSHQGQGIPDPLNLGPSMRLDGSGNGQSGGGVEKEDIILLSQIARLEIYLINRLELKINPDNELKIILGDLYKSISRKEPTEVDFIFNIINVLYDVMLVPTYDKLFEAGTPRVFCEKYVEDIKEFEEWENAELFSKWEQFVQKLHPEHAAAARQLGAKLEAKLREDEDILGLLDKIYRLAFYAVLNRCQSFYESISGIEKEDEKTKMDVDDEIDDEIEDEMLYLCDITDITLNDLIITMRNAIEGGKDYLEELKKAYDFISLTKEEEELLTKDCKRLKEIASEITNIILQKKQEDLTFEMLMLSSGVEHIVKKRGSLKDAIEAVIVSDRSDDKRIFVENLPNELEKIKNSEIVLDSFIDGIRVSIDYHKARMDMEDGEEDVSTLPRGDGSGTTKADIDIITSRYWLEPARRDTEIAQFQSPVDGIYLGKKNNLEIEIYEGNRSRQPPIGVFELDEWKLVDRWDYGVPLRVKYKEKYYEKIVDVITNSRQVSVLERSPSVSGLARARASFPSDVRRRMGSGGGSRNVRKTKKNRRIKKNTKRNKRDKRNKSKKNKTRRKKVTGKKKTIKRV